MRSRSQAIPTLTPMRVPRMSAVAFRRLTIVNLVLLVAIVVSGAIVRLSNSGLGCRDWPNCNATQFVSVATDHAAIEQINRIFSGLIGIPLGITVLMAYQLRPRRRDLVRLAWVLFGLFWCEAIIGGISVEVKLAWFSVMSHFLLALGLISVALRMHQRAGERPGRRELIVAPRAAMLVRVVYVWTIGVVILGTLVTATGPHGGDIEAKRLAIPLSDIARVHGVMVDLLVIFTLVTAYVLARTRAPRVVLNTASLAIGVMIAQGILGYVQYAKEIPSVLVGFHVFGAVLVFGAVQQLVLSITAPIDKTPIDDAPTADAPAVDTAPLAVDALRASPPVRDPVA
jgi:heme a synthase